MTQLSAAADAMDALRELGISAPLTERQRSLIEEAKTALFGTLRVSTDDPPEPPKHPYPGPVAQSSDDVVKALERCAQGVEDHARFWRASAERTSLIEDRLRAENAEALAAFAGGWARKAEAQPTLQP